MNRKSIIIVVISAVLIIIIGLSIAALTGAFKKNAENPVAASDDINTSIQDYQILNENIVNTALSKDSIPPLENPEYISVGDALFLDDYDKVFILEAESAVYIFPQKIMVWHEIVNEIIDGKAVSVTYCPLTGSVIGYEGEIADYSTNTYGTSGNLLNSNLVMYDRETESYIPQILGIAINSGLAGYELNTLPVHWANWIDAKAAYPDALVLSLATGHQRDYFDDPYGSYDPNADPSYYTDGAPMFNVMNDNDGTFSNKKVVVGIKSGSERLAIDPDIVKDEGFLEFVIDGTKGVAFYDDQLNAVRVFYSKLANSDLSFNMSGGVITDNRGISWNTNGISNKSEKLNPMTHFDVMWFAWYAYYPDTAVLK